MAFPFARPIMIKVIMVKGEGGLPFFRKQGTLSNVTYFTHVLNSKSSLYSLKIFFRKEKANSDLPRTRKRKTDSLLCGPLNAAQDTGETMSLGLAFNTQKMVTCQGSGLLLHGLQVEEFDSR